MKKIIFVCVIVFLIGLVILIVINFQTNQYSSFDKEEQKDVTYEEVLQLYNGLMNDCNGAIVWEPGTDLSIQTKDISEHCENEGYDSKLFGYYTDENFSAIIEVKVLKRIDDNVYDVENNFIGTFDASNTEVLFNKGTLYRYTYKWEKGIYQLSRVQYIKPIILEDIGEEESVTVEYQK